MGLTGRLIEDFRAAVRSLGRRPGFAVVAVLTLGVAMGANTTAFSVLEQTLLRPLPFDGAGRLVYLKLEMAAQGFQLVPRVGQVRAWRESAQSLSEIEMVDSVRVTLLGVGTPDGSAEPRTLQAAYASAGLFDLLGVAPRVGAGLYGGGGEAPWDADLRRVVLGHRLWRSAFGADPAVVGRTVYLDDGAYRVAGVMGPELRSLPPITEVDLWLPLDQRLAQMPVDGRDSHGVHALARLAPGVEPEAAEQEIAAFERHQAGGGTLEDFQPRVIPPAELFGQWLGRPVLVLQGAVVMMLLIGCANVGNLFLVRAAGRRRETAVRAALGAGRGRLVRTVLIESLVVACAAGVVGFGLSATAGAVLMRLYPGAGVDLSGLRLDGALFAFTLVAVLLSALAFGLLPALAAGRRDLGEALNGGLRGAGPAGGGRRARAALVITEVALSMVLLVGAGLLAKAFVGLLRTDPGFPTEGLVTVSVELPDLRYGQREERGAFRRSLEEALEASGLEGWALASSAPGSAGILLGSFSPEGGEAVADGAPQTVAWVAAGPEYFHLLGAPVLEGRGFTTEDLAGSDGTAERPALVNEELARLLWPGESAVGRRFALGQGRDAPRHRVVGVVADAAQLSLRGALPLQLYVPLSDGSRLTVLVRADAARRPAVVDRVASAVRTVDARLPIEVRTADELYAQDLDQPRFNAAVMLVFAGVALALSVLGVYAVLSHAVRQRSFEIGVRAALGARPGQVMALVVRHGVLLTGAGIALGLAGSLALVRLLGHLLHGVAPDDPAVLASAAGVLTVATLAASTLPALRAARIDPVRVLRRQ